MIVFLIVITVPYLLTLILCPFYFKLGWFKLFYHDILKWHQPNEKQPIWTDGLSDHSICKHCGREIMQDSQGNWF